MCRNSFSHDKNNKIDISLFSQKLHFRNNYIESSNEEVIDKKIQFRIKKLSDPLSIREASSKLNVDDKFFDPSMIENNAHVDSNDKNLDKVRFVKENSLPTVRAHLTPRQYVDDELRNSVDKSSLLRLHQVEKLQPDEKDCKILNSILKSPKTITELPTKRLN